MRTGPRTPLDSLSRPRQISNLQHGVAPETLCHPTLATECASNIVRRRSDTVKPSALKTMRNSGMHSLRCFRYFLNLSMYRGRENAPDAPPSWKRPKVCVAYSSHASFKAHSPQSDSLHLNMSIWLVWLASSSHKSRSTSRLRGLNFDGWLRKTVILASMKRNISMNCATILISPLSIAPYMGSSASSAVSRHPHTLVVLNLRLLLMSAMPHP